MQDASGVDLTQFRRWYDQAGTPVLEVTDQYDAAKREYAVTFRQSCPPTPGQARSCRFTSRSRSAWSDRTARISHCSSPAKAPYWPTRVLSVKHAAETFRFVGVAASRCLRCARLLRAGDRPVSVYGDRAHAPDGARRRPVQSLGGGPAARARDPLARRRGCRRRTAGRSAACVHRCVCARAAGGTGRSGFRRRSARAALGGLYRGTDGRRRSRCDPRRPDRGPTRDRGRAARSTPRELSRVDHHRALFTGRRIRPAGARCATPASAI